MTRRRGVRVAALVCLALALGALAWSALTWWTASALRGEVALAESAVREARWDEAREGLAAAEGHAARLQWLLPEAVAAVGGRLPVVGSSVVAARPVAVAVRDFVPVALPVIDLAAQVQDSGLRTPDGRIDIAAVRAAGPVLADAAEGARAAVTALSDVPVGVESEDLMSATADLERVSRLLDRAAEASSFLPALLGADGPRTYAVLLQNTAELRGSGGLVGAYALIEMDDGRLTLTEAAARKDGLDASAIPYADVADEDEIATWGADLGEWSTYNLSVDFPLTARLTAAGMAARGTPVDGVVALDARVVAALLAGTGPIEEGGARLTRDNAEDFFTRDIYAKVPDVQAKDDLTVLLLRATLERALEGPIDLPALLGAAVDPVSEGRVRAWSADPETQAWLLTTPLGGELPDEPGPYVAIALNNAAGSKLDAYIGMAARYRVGMCPGGARQRSKLEIRLRNDAPAELPDYVDIRLDRPDAPRGSTSLLVHVYAPQGAGLLWARLDGRGESFTSTQEGGHPVWGFLVDLQRGQEVLLRMAFDEPGVANAQPTLRLPALAAPAAGKVTQRKCPGSAGQG